MLSEGGSPASPSLPQMPALPRALASPPLPAPPRSLLPPPLPAPPLSLASSQCAGSAAVACFAAVRAGRVRRLTASPRSAASPRCAGSAAVATVPGAVKHRAWGVKVAVRALPRQTRCTTAGVRGGCQQQQPSSARTCGSVRVQWLQVCRSYAAMPISMWRAGARAGATGCRPSRPPAVDVPKTFRLP